MNICINSTFDCSIEDFRDLVKRFEDEIRKSVSEFKIAVVNDHEVIMMLNVTDMDGMQTLMSSPEMKQWDSDNNCVDVLYSLEKLT